MQFSIRSVLVAIALTAGTLAAAQASSASARAAGASSPFSIYENLQGSPSTQDQAYELDSSAQFHFTSRFKAALGVPLEFTSGPATSATGTTTTTSASGVGDAYLRLDWTPVNSALTWTTSLTGYAPTGNTSLGLSTGRGLFNWNNHIEHDGDLLSPYVDAGFANSVPNLRHFVRPYKTLGKVGNFDAGTTVSLRQNLDLDLSGYANLPVGAQKVYSRLVHKGQGGPGSGFRNRFETSGSATTAEDNGFSVALEASPQPFLDLSVGFTRSTHLAFNTASFGIGVNVTQLLHGSHQ